MSEKFDLTTFAVDVEAAFFLVGGEKSKATYDWMIAAQERLRIIELLENNCDINHDHFYDKCSCYPNIALIKGEQK